MYDVHTNKKFKNQVKKIFDNFLNSKHIVFRRKRRRGNENLGHIQDRDRGQSRVEGHDPDQGQDRDQGQGQGQEEENPSRYIWL